MDPEKVLAVLNISPRVKETVQGALDDPSTWNTAGYNALLTLIEELGILWASGQSLSKETN